MGRALTLSNLYSRTFDTIELLGIFADVFGNPESSGAWLVYGLEKHGKTWFALMLAQELSRTKKVLYVSAEEGCGKDFVESCTRAQLDTTNRNIHFHEYLSISELREKLTKRRAPEVIFLDNVTIYKDELAYGELRKLLADFDNKLFIFIAHEDRKEPYTSAAKLIRKLAKVIAHVEGLAVQISGRVPGGNLIINEEQSQLYHGILKENL